MPNDPSETPPLSLGDHRPLSKLTDEELGSLSETLTAKFKECVVIARIGQHVYAAVGKNKASECTALPVSKAIQNVRKTCHRKKRADIGLANVDSRKKLGELSEQDFDSLAVSLRAFEIFLEREENGDGFQIRTIPVELSPETHVSSTVAMCELFASIWEIIIDTQDCFCDECTKVLKARSDLTGLIQKLLAG